VDDASDLSDRELAEAVHRRGALMTVEALDRDGRQKLIYVISVPDSDRALDPDEVAAHCFICGADVVHRAHAPPGAIPVCIPHGVELRDRRQVS
jgi:hypothetical protein